MASKRTATPQINLADTAEAQRLAAARAGEVWRRWGPYLSERQWGTVREDYSEHGNAWEYLPHDQARSRAYRWGEDGIAGFGDDQLHLCLGLALWNERDPILKERLFGLTNSEGNHGEDVKELYYYLDGTPTHSWMRMLYKYPQAEFPYAQLVEENRRRGSNDPEFELLDTGVFDDKRYFDVEVTYAKAAPDDILMEVVATNCGNDEAILHIIPQLWARNTWSWKPEAEKPVLRRVGDAEIVAVHPQTPAMRLVCDGTPELLFCDNESNTDRLWAYHTPGFFKDEINDYVVDGNRDAINPAEVGTKAAARYRLIVAGGGSVRLRLRLMPENAKGSLRDFDKILDRRRAEADEFYLALQSDVPDGDACLVQRQALAGMLWSKQFYYFDIPEWLNGDPQQPRPPEPRQQGRNADWAHLNNADIISMPDKWEYPWYAAWDLAFHCVTLAHIDPDFAKDQLLLLTREWYMHPNGQLPAYEWAFGDVNPPVHAWAAWRVYQLDRDRRGTGDREFLERIFHKLMLNFTWWVNRKDADRRPYQPVGWHRLDGDVHAQPDAHRPRARRGQPRLRGHRHQILRAFSLHRRGDDQYRREWHRAVGRGRRVLLRCLEPTRRTPGAAPGTVDGRADPALRGRGARRLRLQPLARICPSAPLVPRIPTGPGTARLALDRSQCRRAAPAVAAARASHQASARPHARRKRVPVRVRDPGGLEVSREQSLCLRARRKPLQHRLCAGRVDLGRVRRQLELARSDLDAGQFFADRIIAAVSPVLRGRFHGRMPDRLGVLSQPRSGRHGTIETADPAVPQGR